MSEHCVMTSNSIMCKKCLDKYMPALPMPVKKLCAISSWFIKLHKDCEVNKHGPHLDTSIRSHAAVEELTNE